MVDAPDADGEARDGENLEGEDLDGDDRTRVAIACQGGGSHTAFTAGALQSLLADPDVEVVGLSGASGGAVCATAAWYGLLAPAETPESVLEGVWQDVAASTPVDRALNDWTVWGSTVESTGFPTPELSPYQNPAAAIGQRRLRRALTDNIDFDRFAALADGDDDHTDPLDSDEPPRLAVGTVNVDAGAFETFVDGDVTADAVLASAAIPDLFPGVEIDGHLHWDGMFAQNPPIRALVHGPKARKPEEVWVVQINPQHVDDRPTTLREIRDRRNELAGNISLTQQLHFLQRVNEWVEAGHLPESTFQRIRVRRIELERDLDYSSKLDRDPAFIDDLVGFGVDAAREFCEQRRTGDLTEPFQVDATAAHDAHVDDD
jgi:NTE family protein